MKKKVVAKKVSTLKVDVSTSKSAMPKIMASKSLTMLGISLITLLILGILGWLVISTPFAKDVREAKQLNAIASKNLCEGKTELAVDSFFVQKSDTIISDMTITGKAKSTQVVPGRFRQGAPMDSCKISFEWKQSQKGQTVTKKTTIDIVVVGADLSFSPTLSALTSDFGEANQLFNKDYPASTIFYINPLVVPSSL